MKKTKRFLPTALLARAMLVVTMLVAALSTPLLTHLSAREKLEAGQEGKMLDTVCKVKKEEMQSMRELINILSGRVSVKRVQLTRGNCYLVTGKVGSNRYMGLFDPVEFDELFYIIK